MDSYLLMLCLFIYFETPLRSHDDAQSDAVTHRAGSSEHRASTERESARARESERAGERITAVLANKRAAHGSGERKNIYWVISHSLPPSR